MTGSFRLRVEVTRIDPITVRNDHLFLLAGDLVVWNAPADDPARSNLLPHFDTVAVVDERIDAGTEGLKAIVTLVNDTSKKKQRVHAVCGVVGQMLGALPSIPVRGVGRLAPGSILQGALGVAEAFSNADWHDVLGGVFLKAVPSDHGLLVLCSTRNEKYPLLRLDENDEVIVDNSLNWESETMLPGDELRLVTGCHEGGRCRVQLYLRVEVTEVR